MNSDIIWKVIVGSSIIASLTSKALEEILGLFKELIVNKFSTRSKKKEKIIEKQINIHEALYKLILGLAPDFSENWKIEVLPKINTLENYLIEHNLYIDHRIKSISYEAKDYYLKVAAGAVVYEVKEEIRIQEQFKSKFHG